MADDIRENAMAGGTPARLRGLAANGNSTGSDVVQPAGINADLPHKAAGTHAAGDRCAVHLHAENACRDGARHSGSERRRKPDARVLDDVRHLQHGSADALRKEAAPAVIAEADDRKADHLRTAACNGRAARKARQTERRADGRAGNRQRQCNADDDGNENTHEERLLGGCPHDQVAHAGSRRADVRRE